MPGLGCFVAIFSNTSCNLRCFAFSFWNYWSQRVPGAYFHVFTKVFGLKWSFGFSKHLRFGTKLYMKLTDQLILMCSRRMDDYRQHKDRVLKEVTGYKKVGPCSISLKKVQYVSNNSTIPPWHIFPSATSPCVSTCSFKKFWKKTFPDRQTFSERWRKTF